MESIYQYAEKSCSVLAITGRLRQMNVALSNEPRHEKTGFLPMRKQRRRSAFAVTAKLISAFVFATRIVHFLFLLNPKFQASMLLLGLYMSVCVRPGWKPRRPVFSRRGSLILNFEMMFNRIFNGKKDKCIT